MDVPYTDLRTELFVKSDSIRFSLATVSILGQPPSAVLTIMLTEK